MSSLQQRPGGLGQRVLLTLGDTDWVLVHQDWFLRICKVTYHRHQHPWWKPRFSQWTMRENTACHCPGQICQWGTWWQQEQKSSGGGAQLNSPGHNTHVKVTLTCLHKTILASHICGFWVLSLFNLTYKICCTCICQLYSVHTVDPTHISANLLCTGSCCWGLPFQLGDRCFCLCTCALTWHWSQCAEGCFYNMKKIVVEPLFPGVGYKALSSDGAEAKHQKAVPLFVLTSSCHTELS